MYPQFTDKPEDEELTNADTMDEETLGHGFKAFLPKPKANDSGSVTNTATEGICNYRGKCF